MQNVTTLLEKAGSSLEHICRVTTYLTAPGWRPPVYNTVNRYLKDIPTVGTGLIVKGLAKPKMKVELDIDAVILETGSHTKIRTFDTDDWFGGSRACAAAPAGQCARIRRFTCEVSLEQRWTAVPCTALAARRRMQPRRPTTP